MRFVHFLVCLSAKKIFYRLFFLFILKILLLRFIYRNLLGVLSWITIIYWRHYWKLLFENVPSRLNWTDVAIIAIEKCLYNIVMDYHFNSILLLVLNWLIILNNRRSEIFIQERLDSHKIVYTKININKRAS